MSHLSDRCQQFLTESGTSVYQLSKTSGLDRASLHRLVTGKRTPTLDFLMKFCDAMRLNHADVQELLRLYEEAHAGRAAFRNREMIRDLFSSLSDLAEEPDSFSHTMLSGTAADIWKLPRQTNSSLQTQTLIARFLENVFKDPGEDNDILTNVPLARMEFLPVVYNLHKVYPKQIRLRHLFYFSSNPNLAEESNPNLEIMKWVLPMALSDFDFYEPCYTYLKSSKNDLEMLLWPYYLICGGTAIVISASLTSAVVHQDPLIVRAYRMEMQKQLDRSKPLAAFSRTMEESIDFYQSFTSQENPLVSVLEYQPCLSPFIPMKYYQDFLSQIEPLKSQEQLFRAFLSNSNFPQRQSAFYFSREGLASFCRTGKLLGQYGTYLPPLPVSVRKQCLGQFCSAYSEIPSIRLLKENFQIPANLNVELHRHNSVLFMVFEQDFRIRFISISETSLYEAFYDFFQSLAEPYHSFSHEETLAEIRHFIQTLP